MAGHGRGPTHRSCSLQLGNRCRPQLRRALSPELSDRVELTNLRLVELTPDDRLDLRGGETAATRRRRVGDDRCDASTEITEVDAAIELDLTEQHRVVVQDETPVDELRPMIRIRDVKVACAVPGVRAARERA